MQMGLKMMESGNQVTVGLMAIIMVLILLMKIQMGLLMGMTNMSTQLIPTLKQMKTITQKFGLQPMVSGIQEKLYMIMVKMVNLIQ